MEIYNQNIYLNKTVYFNVGPRSPTIHRQQGIRWPQFLKLQIYSPHPPLKEENVGRGGEKEEDEEKPVTSSSSLLWANFLTFK